MTWVNNWLTVLPGVVLVLLSRSAVTEEHPPATKEIQTASSASADDRSAASRQHVVDLGKLDGTTTLTVTLDDSLPEVFYKLTIGRGDCVEWERTRFEGLHLSS